MKGKFFLARVTATVVVALILTQFPMASSPAFVLKAQEGFLCVQEISTGDWIFSSTIRADSFSHRDQLLLECGIFLHDQADFTRALEDFCS